MIEKITEYYKMEFYDSYVIIEVLRDFVVNSVIAKLTLEVIIDHFGRKEFIIISNRKSNYSLNPDAYSLSLFKKVKGIAVVSQNPEVKANAIKEQENFQQSFAFFENMDDAKNWAESFVVSY